MSDRRFYVSGYSLEGYKTSGHSAQIFVKVEKLGTVNIFPDKLY